MDADRRRLRMPVDLGVCPVQEVHDLDVPPAGVHRMGRQLLDGHDLAAQGVQLLVEEPVYALVLITQDEGVVRVRRAALQSEQDQVVKALDDIAAFLGPAPRRVLPARYRHVGHALGERVRSRAGEGLGGPARAGAGVLVELPRLAPDDPCLGDHLGHADVVEVDVGHRREKRLDHEAVDLPVDRPEAARTVRVHRNSLCCVDQKVLKVRNLPGLAAHPHHGAACPLGSLLTLVTEHRNSPSFLSKSTGL